MSHQDNFTHESKSQEPFNFLKAVVNDDSGQAKNGTDSDKENDHNGSISNTQQFEFDLSSEKVKDSTPMSREEKDMWDEFYNENDFEEIASKDNPPNDLDNSRHVVNNERILDKVEEEEEEEDHVDASYTTDTVESNTKDDDDEDNTDSRCHEDDVVRPNKKKKRKKLFKRIRPQSSHNTRTQPLGGSDPNLVQHSGHNRHSSSDQHSNQLETMSETSGTERKLSRRKQVSRPRCAGPTPKGDRLEQKYQELEQLMLKPLANPAVYVQQTRQQMLRLQGLSPQHHKSSHQAAAGLPPTGQAAPREIGKANIIIQEIEEDTNQAYSTIRTVHIVNSTNRSNRPKSAHPRRRPLSGQRQKRPQSAEQVRSVATEGSESNSVLSNINLNNNNNNEGNSRGRKQIIRKGLRKIRSDSTGSAGSQKRSDRSESGSKDREYTSSIQDETRSRSSSCSPGRAIQTTDNHLKNSSNPALRQWLKVKDKEYRKQKMEERKKKRREREEKQEEEMKKQEFLQQAEERVKEWMTRKKKEAWKHAKEERRQRKEDEKEIIERQQNNTDSLRGKMFTPIKRPAGKYETETKDPGQQQQQQDNAPTTPQPPKSKFVYKRPVSGRVRLMKLQQERKDDTKKAEAQKKEMDRLLAEEKEKKMRMSYDQWLLKKRENDYKKRQEAARQRSLAKSDPELDRIVPEMARRRIENIKRGKKRIQSGDRSIDENVNKSFGGGDFGDDELSNRLHVSGDKKSLKQRPSSAKPTSSGAMLNPKMSKSPRRPQSANPRVQALMDESIEVNPDNAFKLPFPPELGVPKYVAARQEKLFSPKVISDASTTNSNSMSASLNGSQDKLTTENSQSEVQGSDEVDAKIDDLSKLHSADSVKEPNGDANTEECGKVDDEEEQSFFVTHGNVDKETESTNMKETTEKEVLQEEDDGFGDNTEESIHGNLQTQEIVDEDAQETVEEEKSEIEPTIDIDSDKEEKDKEQENATVENAYDENSAVVPPLDIGDDDVEIKYEEEKMDIFDAPNGNEKEEQTYISKLIDMVEHSLDTAEIKTAEIKTAEIKTPTKHVSFSEQNTIHEDPLAGISGDFDLFYDSDDQIQVGEDNDDKNEDSAPKDSTSEDFDDNEYEEIEGYHDEDEEAEDERGGYYDDGTPRDDF